MRRPRRKYNIAPKGLMLRLETDALVLHDHRYRRDCESFDVTVARTGGEHASRPYQVNIGLDTYYVSELGMRRLAKLFHEARRL